jgi:phosphatidylserine/phosphatidylglycerophosphate/cardiolipin synthase-like enzyme
MGKYCKTEMWIKNFLGRTIVLFTLLTVITASLWMVLSPLITLPQEKTSTWEVYFSPHGGCTEAVVIELDKAESSVLVQAYSFTSAPIAKALVAAHERGARWKSSINDQKAGGNNRPAFGPEIH